MKNTFHWRFSAGTVLVLAGTLFISLLSCGPDSRSKPGEIARWEKKFSQSKKTNRELADAIGPRCFKDRVSLDSLRMEVKSLEAAFPLAPQGSLWQGIDFSKNSSPQNDYISKFSQLIDTSVINVGQCTDLVCVLEQIYGDEESALLDYLFFLKTGYGLGADQTNPHVSRRAEQTYKEFLFSKPELGAFYTVANSIPSLYFNMPSLQDIYRLAPREKLVGMGGCGENWSSPHEGSIVLMDKCLDFTVPENHFTGFIYTAISHEMTHSLDKVFRKDAFTFSDTDEWTALSGWKTNEYLDPTTQKPIRQWVSTPGADGFVRDYAASSPVEDFADTVAHFRFVASVALVKSPLKSAWISEHIFQGRTFDDPGLIKYYQKVTDSGVRAQLLQRVQECLSVSGGDPGDAEVSDWDLKVRSVIPLSPNSLKCLNRGIVSDIKAQFAALRLGEFEGCAILDKNDFAMAKQVVSDLQIDLDQILSEQNAIAPKVKALAQLREDLKDGLDERETFLSCYSETDPKTCYEKIVSDGFDQAVRSYAGILKDWVAAEKAHYLEVNSYDAAQTAVSKTFSAIFSGIEIPLAKQSQAIWLKCSTSISTPISGADKPQVVPFDGGAHFVSTDLLNCLNTEIPETITHLIQHSASSLGFSVSAPNTLLYLKNRELPLVLASLQANVDREGKLEDQKREAMRVQVTDALVQSLLSDLTWLGSPLPTLDSAKGLCGPQAMKNWDGIAKALEPIPTTFASLDDLKARWILDACAIAVVSPTVNTAYKTEENAKVQNGLPSLNGIVVSDAAQVASSCARQYSRKFLSPLRKRCLINHWGAVETQAVQDWLTQTQLTGRHSDAEDYLKAHRDGFQAQAIDEMERRI